ncbi:Alkaline proteinase inhibitor precursor [Pseudomonas chlororaphis subsp. aurantiaca]|nr:Alkaline proteinase inhibitor precursor [Pseudomonas chlororaphis subsp. aurantiaca]
MIRTALIAKAGAYLIATLMMFYGETSMASSLRLADPAELAGHWQLSQPAQPASHCALDLELNGTLGAGAECFPPGWAIRPSAGFPSRTVLP